MNFIFDIKKLLLIVWDVIRQCSCIKKKLKFNFSMGSWEVRYTLHFLQDFSNIKKKQNKTLQIWPHGSLAQSILLFSTA